MTPEEILEYNKLCAEFVGWKKTHPNIKEWHLYITPIGHVSYDKMLFHTDWNWIMEMIEAIEKLYNHPNNEINVDIKAGQIEIFQRPFRLENNDYHEIIYLGDGYINGSKKEAVIEAMYQFLKWYKTQNV